MNRSVWMYLLVMAGVTYLIRALPLTMLRREIGSSLIRSFLYYVPYVTLAVMIFPGILYVTGSLLSALLGFVAAIVVALRKGNLILVSALACLTVFFTELILA